MQKDIIEQCEWVVETTKRAGADDCRATIFKQREVNVEYRDRKPDTVKEATTKELNLNIYVDGRYSVHSTSDLRDEVLKEFIKKAIANTKLLEEDPYRSLPDPRYYKGRSDTELEIFDKTYESFTPEKRHELVKAIEDNCLKNGGDKVISVTAGISDYIYEEIKMTSNGFEGKRKSTSYTLGAEMSMQDEGDRRPEGSNYIRNRILKYMPSPENIGNTTVKRTLNLMGAEKIKTENLPIIIENRNAARVLGGFLGALSGANIQQKTSFLLDKKGKKVGSKIFTLVDDPLLIGGLGSKHYDNDCFTANKRTIVDSGVLQDFLIDWYYSRKLDCKPTGGSTSNLILPPGNRSVEEIMKDLGRGVYITGFIGGNSNSTTGDFSVGIMGQLFDNGVPVKTIAEMNIADNHGEFWNKLVEVGNDPWIYSSWRTPSLVFEDIVVSGT